MCEALLTLLLNHERWRRDNIIVTLEVEVNLQEAKAISTQDGNNVVADEASMSSFNNLSPKLKC
jgi:hypothetical protein